MKYKESDFRKRALIQKKASELSRKEEAWKKYEMHLRRAKSGDSELELDD